MDFADDLLSIDECLNNTKKRLELDKGTAENVSLWMSLERKQYMCLYLYITTHYINHMNFNTLFSIESLSASYGSVGKTYNFNI